MSRFPGYGGATASAAVAMAAVFLVMGCAANAPIGNFWRLYGFGSDDVVRMDPEAIRAAIKLPLPVQPRAEDAMLRLEFEPDGEADRRTEHEFPMVLVNQGRTVRARGLLSAEPGYNWYLFKLKPAAESELSRVQAELAGSDGESSGAVKISVVNRFDNAVPGQQLSRSVWIQFSEDEGFIALVDEEKVIIDEQGRPAR